MKDKIEQAIREEIVIKNGEGVYIDVMELTDKIMKIIAESDKTQYIPKCDKCGDKYWIYEPDGSKHGCDCHY